MTFEKVETGYIVRIMRDEDVFEVLPRFCKEKNISSAWLSGLGAVKHATCGYYDLDKKEYVLTEYNNLIELISMVGNVAIHQGEPVLHVHATFSDHSNHAFGGHVTSLRAGVTIEVHLVDHKMVTEREHDSFSHLNLLCLNETYD